MTNTKLNNSSLLFVYNADNDFLSLLKDMALKLTKPDNTSCQLCNLTYSVFGMRKNWREFIDGLDITCESLHKNELIAQHAELSNVALPAVFMKTDHDIKLWLSADELNACHTLIDLRELMTDRLA